MHHVPNLRLIATLVFGAWLSVVAGSCSTESAPESELEPDGLSDAGEVGDASISTVLDASEPSDPIGVLLDASLGEVTDAGFVSLDFGLLPTPALSAEAGYSSLQGLADAEVVSLGGGAVSFDARWDELSAGAELDDPVPTFPALDAWQQRLAPFASALRVSFVLSIVDRTERAAPFDDSTNWGDSDLVAQARLLIDRIYARLGPQLSVLSLGRDLDRYLSRLNPDEADAFQQFVIELLDYARTQPARPEGLQVGLLATLGGWAEPTERLQAMARAADVPVISYYPMDETSQALEPNQAVDEFAAGVSAIVGRGFRNLVVHEIAYPSAVEVASSGQQQAEFYDALFNRLLKLAPQVSLVGVRALHDGQASDCQREARTFGQPSESELAAWLCSTGVKSVDSRAKPAYRSVLRALATFHGE